MSATPTGRHAATPPVPPGASPGAAPGVDPPVATSTGPAAAAHSPQATWQGGPQRWTLILAGDWRAPRADDASVGGGAVADDANANANANAYAYAYANAYAYAYANASASAAQRLASTVPLPPPLTVGAQVVFDGQALAGWDSSLAARLWTLTEILRPLGAQVQLDGLPAGLREIVALAAPPANGQTDGQTDGQTNGQTIGQSKGPTNGLADTGATSPADTSAGTSANTAATHTAHAARATGPLAEAAVTAAFLGEVLIAVGRWLRGRSALRAADVLQQLDLAGPRSLPIVGLTCGLIGLMLAYMAGAQLGRIGAQNFLADVVTVGMVRELAGLMTGIILAGRVGSAFAAQLATMEAGEEIDALRVLGIDPISHLVLPRLLALALVAPALIGFGALAGVLAGWPAAVGAYGVTSAEYFHQCLRALNGTHLAIGLFKGLLYAALAGLAGCREGLHAGRSAQAVGAATTAAVVKALVWIVAAACGTTVLFTNLGY